MREHPELAGFVAQDFAAWQYWDAVPEYVALLKSGVPQQIASRVAATAYLRQSPEGGRDVGLPASAMRAADPAGVAAFPMPPGSVPTQ